MINTLTVQTVKDLIQQEKCKSRRSCKIKVIQFESIENKTKMYLQTLGLKNVEKYLFENGYSFEYKKTDKQITIGYDLTGKINKCQERKLYTTTLVIKW
jgi:hypothetical protein